MRDSELSNIRQHIRGPYRALMLFGSYARGDQSPTSDIDILQVADAGGRSYRTGKVAVAVYSLARLREMAREGSLFILHLICDGKILDDPYECFRPAFAEYVRPSNYLRLRSELSIALKLLDVTDAFYADHARELNQVASFIFRTVVYAKQAEVGRPCFSLRVAARQLPNVPVGATDIHAHAAPVLACYRAIQSWLAAELGVSADNECGSIEALLVRHHASSSMVIQLGIKILSHGTEEVNYA